MVVLLRHILAGIETIPRAVILETHLKSAPKVVLLHTFDVFLLCVGTFCFWPYSTSI